MRVLVISDTHIHNAGKELPTILKKEAKKSDCCIHAGDFISYEVFKAISAWTKTYGVCGNMDDTEVKEKLPSKEIIKLGEIKLGLIHGQAAPSDLIYYINKKFSKNLEEIDIFVFGHSHAPMDKEINGKFYFNPGSPTDKVFTPYCSYGILEIDGKEISRRIVKIE
ncbi:MAG: metallophosphoesterase [Candidatus Omnitrophica bacterium]|nr:metallophosphoesterase [Candidatus Omnitrophota bacterium]MBU0879053.1 metallophosphoesterase [Candidatus Omnitrophota bacterium]MBU0896342.1 metallophosphoesterase [Candidatus Omnitrophota bacterium]MBU1133308.1 metallophosphoesterase [Candidatus Omnitrophota bacterium]MBU1523358.1 metallophosphoesterase [Candidatus Omnitrophota bacterium]